MENNMFEDIVAEGNIVVINNNWIVLCKRWKPWCHNLFCYLYLHKENKNLMVGSHFTMTEDKKKSTRLATNEERLMLLRKCLSMELLSISTSIIWLESWLVYED